MLCLDPKFHMYRSETSLVIAMKPKIKYRFHALAELFFCIQKDFIKKVAYSSKIYEYYNTAFQDLY